MLDSEEFATTAELANREGIALTYMTRALRLNLLAPSIVEAIVEGRQGPETKLADLLVLFPAEWAAQRCHLGDVS